MRLKFIISLLALTNISLVAAPSMEPKPEAPYFEKFQPLKAPAIHGLLLKKGDRLAICGDSITEQKMYSRIMEDYLTMCVPDLKVTVRQYGWSGEKAPGFLGRMTNDCLRFNPTVATTCYGMNDCEYHVYEDRIGRTYQENSQRIVEAFKAHNVRVVLGSAGCISKMPPWAINNGATLEQLDLNLCNLRNLDEQLAQEENVRFADVFWPMLTGDYAAKQKYDPNYSIAGKDGVHPGWSGHTLMAYAYLKAMGLDGNIGTFTIDLKRNKAKVSSGHKVISAKDGEFQIESSRYPFCACEAESQVNYPTCGQDSTNSDNSIRSGETLVPFNEDLNRLMLVVKNAGAKEYQVTWGDETKTFTGEQLTQGINLAVEFPANPFTAAFAKVDAAVAAKQAYETKEIKDIFHHHGNESLTEHTDKVVGQAEQDRAPLANAVSAAFVPVTHTIRIVEK
ncbi:MAG TPA: SGNH/GDSL hydrolase family protein [Verrucomicrobiae bacterium]|jgi:lysophospholipase L1-like esterase|nr:SGNH/GDSL hydrolase family protein [Verrucomicrobiae bacterium]